jgi:broad specificity phosphatase PhoE
LSEIYLIRHGQASFGAGDYDRLSDLGTRQARILGAHLGRVGRAFDAVYCGRMRRQQETAAGLREAYAGCGLELPAACELEALDEYDSMGVWNALLPRVIAEQPELKPDAERAAGDRKSFQRLFSAVMSRWVQGGADLPGVVRWADFRQQAQRGLQEIMAQEGGRKIVAVFTSGGPICVAVQAALGLSDPAALELSWQIWNASVTRIRFSARGSALTVFNEVSHLELERDPGLLTYR